MRVWAVLILLVVLVSGCAKLQSSEITTTQIPEAEETPKETQTDVGFNNLSYYDWRVQIIYDLVEVGRECEGLTSLKCRIIGDEFRAKYDKKVRWIGIVQNVGKNALGNLEVRAQLHEDESGVLFKIAGRTHQINMEKLVYFNPEDLETAMNLDIGDRIELEMMVDTDCYYIDTCQFDLEVLSFKKI